MSSRLRVLELIAMTSQILCGSPTFCTNGLIASTAGTLLITLESAAVTAVSVQTFSRWALRAIGGLPSDTDSPQQSPAPALRIQ